MANYIIIGGDQKEYGPITADDMRQWIAEGRLNEHSQIKAEGAAEFRPLGTFPEFAAAFSAGDSTPDAPSSYTSATDLSQLDYELDMGSCITHGWELVKNNFGLLFVVTLVVMLIEGAIGGLGSIPMIGPVFTIANLIIAGPLMGGLYYVILQTGRGESAEVGDVFAGFRKAFAQLFLGHLVPALLAGLCLIPFVIVFVMTLMPLMVNGKLDPDQVRAMSGLSVAILAATAVICAIPVIYLKTCWAFTLPLVIDKGMDFWTAMGASRKMVSKHWWRVFGVMVLIGLLNIAGFCACCVGVLFTMPIGFAALMFAYETIFSEEPPA
ncbi:MAG: DUF975 family protein [Verrucomicrobiales bacterium]|nr:DUF975 family protein [Verrucomicrobiales bacterium]